MLKIKQKHQINLNGNIKNNITNDMMIIILNGSNSTGKDNFANFFIKHYEFKATNMSTIDRIKEIAIKYFGWNGRKTDEARRFLAEMKRIWAEYNNGPFLYMTKKIKEHYSKLNKKDKKNFIYFIHCREPEEIQKFKDKYKDKCLTILLKRDDRVVANNDADKNVANYNYDRIIINDGSKINLELDAVKFVEDMIKILKENKEKLK